MSAYVDRLRSYPRAMYHSEDRALRVGERNGHEWCHLLADTKAELLATAKRIGLRSSWLQTREGTYPSDVGRYHFDLTPQRRRLAVQSGAIEVTDRELVDLIRGRKAAL